MTDDDLHGPWVTALGTALRDRVRDELPDLEALVRSSTRTGTRIRRRRRAGTAIATAAGVAAVAVVGSQLGGGPAATSGRDPDFATAPSGSVEESESTTIDELQLEAALERLSRLQDEGRLDSALMPVRVAAPGWTCDPPADQKLGCTSGSAVVSVVARPVAHHEAYQDPAKTDNVPGVRTFVSAPHGRWFVTVAPGSGATQADLDAVAAGLVWK